MSTFPVKNFLSTDTGAPALTGTAGAMISLLDALLVTGFNLKSVISLTQTAGVATATFASSHGYRPYQVVEIAGCTGGSAGFNSQYMIASTTTNTITFPVDSALPGTAAGEVTAKVAPLGWEKTFDDTNKAAYKSVASGATGCYLYVDDTNAGYAIVRGYENLTDINTGTGPFPSSSQQANYYWQRYYGGSTTQAKRYEFFGTDRCFYHAIAFNTNSGSGHSGNQWPPIYGFGDFPSFKPADSFNCMIAGSTINSTPYPSYDYGSPQTGLSCDWNHSYAPRNYTQFGGAVELWGIGNRIPYISGSNDPAQGASTYPNPTDNSLLIGSRQFYLDKYDNNAINRNYRGIKPGLYWLLQAIPMSPNDIVDGVVGYDGKVFMLVSCTAYFAYEGRIAIDLTGPWHVS